MTEKEIIKPEDIGEMPAEILETVETDEDVDMDDEPEDDEDDE